MELEKGKERLALEVLELSGRIRWMQIEEGMMKNGRVGASVDAGMKEEEEGWSEDESVDTPWDCLYPLFHIAAECATAVGCRELDDLPDAVREVVSLSRNNAKALGRLNDAADGALSVLESYSQPSSSQRGRSTSGSSVPARDTQPEERLSPSPPHTGRVRTIDLLEAAENTAWRLEAAAEWARSIIDELEEECDCISRISADRERDGLQLRGALQRAEANCKHWIGEPTEEERREDEALAAAAAAAAAAANAISARAASAPNGGHLAGLNSTPANPSHHGGRRRRRGGAGGAAATAGALDGGPAPRAEIISAAAVCADFQRVFERLLGRVGQERDVLLRCVDILSPPMMTSAVADDMTVSAASLLPPGGGQVREDTLPQVCAALVKELEKRRRYMALHPPTPVDVAANTEFELESLRNAARVARANLETALCTVAAPVSTYSHHHHHHETMSGLSLSAGEPSIMMSGTAAALPMSDDATSAGKKQETAEDEITQTGGGGGRRRKRLAPAIESLSGEASRALRALYAAALESVQGLQSMGVQPVQHSSALDISMPWTASPSPDRTSRSGGATPGGGAAAAALGEGGGTTPPHHHGGEQESTNDEPSVVPAASSTAPPPFLLLSPLHLQDMANHVTSTSGGGGRHSTSLSSAPSPDATSAAVPIVHALTRIVQGAMAELERRRREKSKDEHRASRAGKRYQQEIEVMERERDALAARLAETSQAHEMSLLDGRRCHAAGEAVVQRLRQLVAEVGEASAWATATSLLSVLPAAAPATTTNTTTTTPPKLRDSRSEDEEEDEDEDKKAASTPSKRKEEEERRKSHEEEMGEGESEEGDADNHNHHHNSRIHQDPLAATRRPRNRSKDDGDQEEQGRVHQPTVPLLMEREVARWESLLACPLLRQLVTHCATLVSQLQAAQDQMAAQAQSDAAKLLALQTEAARLESERQSLEDALAASRDQVAQLEHRPTHDAFEAEKHARHSLEEALVSLLHFTRNTLTTTTTSTPDHQTASQPLLLIPTLTDRTPADCFQGLRSMAVCARDALLAAPRAGELEALQSALQESREVAAEHAGRHERLQEACRTSLAPYLTSPDTTRQEQEVEPNPNPHTTTTTTAHEGGGSGVHLSASSLITPDWVAMAGDTLRRSRDGVRRCRETLERLASGPSSAATSHSAEEGSRPAPDSSPTPIHRPMEKEVQTLSEAVVSVGLQVAQMRRAISHVSHGAGLPVPQVDKETGKKKAGGESPRVPKPQETETEEEDNKHKEKEGEEDAFSRWGTAILAALQSATETAAQRAAELERRAASEVVLTDDQVAVSSAFLDALADLIVAYGGQLTLPMVAEQLLPLVDELFPDDPTVRQWREEQQQQPTGNSGGASAEHMAAASGGEEEKQKHVHNNDDAVAAGTASPSSARKRPRRPNANALPEAVRDQLALFHSLRHLVQHLKGRETERDTAYQTLHSQYQQLEEEQMDAARTILTLRQLVQQKVVSDQALETSLRQLDVELDQQGRELAMKYQADQDTIYRQFTRLRDTIHEAVLQHPSTTGGGLGSPSHSVSSQQQQRGLPSTTISSLGHRQRGAPLAAAHHTMSSDRPRHRDRGRLGGASIPSTPTSAAVSARRRHTDPYPDADLFGGDIGSYE